MVWKIALVLDSDYSVEDLGKLMHMMPAWAVETAARKTAAIASKLAIYGLLIRPSRSSPPGVVMITWRFVGISLARFLSTTHMPHACN